MLFRSGYWSKRKRWCVLDHSLIPYGSWVIADGFVGQLVGEDTTYHWAFIDDDGTIFTVQTTDVVQITKEVADVMRGV